MIFYEEKVTSAADLQTDGPFQGMNDQDAFLKIQTEVNRARDRYPQWPTNLVMAASIALEEAGEVLKDCNTLQWAQGDADIESGRKEAIQAAAMWIRFLCDTPAFRQ